MPAVGRWWALGWLSVALLGVPAWTAPAAAADVDDIAAELSRNGVYVEPGSDVEQGAVATAVREVQSTYGVDLRLAALAEEPPGGLADAAQELSARVGGTVIVLTDDGFESHSDNYDSETMDQAADEAFTSFANDDDAQGLRQFGAALSNPGAPGSTTAPASGGGFGLGTFLVLAMLVIGGVAMVNGSRSTRKLAQRRVDEARREVRHQIDSMAERILAVSDRVTIGSPEAQAAYAEATVAFQQASDAFAGATTEPQLADLNEVLDRARWHLDTSAALLDGKEPPASPAGDVGACFFDPDHGAGVKPATLNTPAGSREVGVCDYCAAKLERGEAPLPRQVEVNGRQIPAGMAPREYGGRGMHDLGAFTILFGSGGAIPYQWGSPYRRRRSTVGWGGGSGGWGGGGGFGGGIGGGGAGRRFGGGGAGRRFGGGGAGRRFGGGGAGRRF